LHLPRQVETYLPDQLDAIAKRKSIFRYRFALTAKEFRTAPKNSPVDT
jgi:hypothetical protein